MNLTMTTDSEAGPCIGTAASCIASALAFTGLKFNLGNPAKGAIELGSFASPAQVTALVIDSMHASACDGQSVPLVGMWGVGGGLSNITFSGRSVLTGPTVANAGTVLSGTVTLVNGDVGVTFSAAQSLLAGQMLNFSAQPGVVYEVKTATSASFTATLTAAYFGTSSSTSTATAVAEFLHIESTDTNAIDNINVQGLICEVPYAGAVKLRGVRNSKFDLWMGDLNPVAPIAHQVWIGKSSAAGSAPALSIAFENVQSDSGMQDAATIYTGNDASTQSISIRNSVIPWVQNVRTGGPYAANQGYLPLRLDGSSLEGYSGDQPMGIDTNTLARYWTIATAPEPLPLTNNRNSNVTGTGNLRGAYRITGPTNCFSIDGIQIGNWGGQPIDGVELVIINPTSHPMTIVDASRSGSSPAYQILCGGGSDIVQGGPGCVSLKYDLTTAMWRVVSHNP